MSVLNYNFMCEIVTGVPCAMMQSTVIHLKKPVWLHRSLTKDHALR